MVWRETNKSAKKVEMISILSFSSSFPPFFLLLHPIANYIKSSFANFWKRFLSYWIWPKSFIISKSNGPKIVLSADVKWTKNESKVIFLNPKSPKSAYNFCFRIICSIWNDGFWLFSKSSIFVLQTYYRSSTCPLTSFFWLLSHVIYLKLTRVF